MKVAVSFFGLHQLCGGDHRAALDAATMADELGIDHIVAADHVAVGPGTEDYPFPGQYGYPMNEPWPEPLISLAAMAAVTKQVRLATSVLLAPLRPAALLAKQAATLDVLSHGRLDLGVGAGWLRAEFDASGVAYEGRNRRMDDVVRACRALWSGAPVSFSSPTITFNDIWSLPLPVQPGGVPIWFGGGANAATARRIAELGVGWLPFDPTPEHLSRGIELISAAFQEVGREPSTLQVQALLRPIRRDDGRLDLEAMLETIPHLESLGVTSVGVQASAFIDRADGLESFLGRVAAARA